MQKSVRALSKLTAVRPGNSQNNMQHYCSLVNKWNTNFPDALAAPACVCFCWLKRHREPMAGGSSGTVCTSVGAHLLCAVISGPQAFNYIQTQYESSCHFSHLFPFFVMKWFHVHVTEWVTERDRDTMSKPERSSLLWWWAIRRLQEKQTTHNHPVQPQHRFLQVHNLNDSVSVATLLPGDSSGGPGWCLSNDGDGQS